MNNIYNIDFTRMLPPSLKQDPDMVTLSNIIADELNKTVNQIRENIIFARIDELSEKVLDVLAYDLHIDWYDATVDISVKRQLIKKSIKVHRYRGTPYAVKEVLSDYFEKAEIKEWYEYDGEPYTFKVLVRNQVVSGELANRFRLALNSVKNTRSHLQEIIYGYFCSESTFCSEKLTII